MLRGKAPDKPEFVDDIVRIRTIKHLETYNSDLCSKNLFVVFTDLRDTSGEKIPFVSVGITRLDLMFRKTSKIQF